MNCSPLPRARPVLMHFTIYLDITYSIRLIGTYCSAVLQALIEVLLEVLPDYVGPNFDDGAWNACLHVIADGVMS